MGTARIKEDKETEEERKQKLVTLEYRFTSEQVFLRFTHCALVVALLENDKYTIQYGYRKCGTYARAFSETLAHGNIQNEIRQINQRKM